MPCVTKGVKDQAGFLRRLLLDGHNCQRQYILVFQQPSSFLWENFAGVEDTNSFLFLSQEWHRMCRKGFTEQALAKAQNEQHPFLSFQRDKIIARRRKRFVDERLDLLQHTTSLPWNCLFFYHLHEYSFALGTT